MRRIARPALIYLAVMFAAAFCIGVMRVLWVVPRLGEMAAVLIEVPLVLGLSWAVCGAVLRRRPLPRAGDRAAMGTLAFAGLIALELALGRFGFGRSLAQSLAAMATPPGLAGLAGQIGFGLIPLLRRQSG